MEIIEAQEVNAAAVDAERDKLYQQRVTGSLMDAVTTTNPNDTTSIVGAVAGLTSALVSGTDKKTHRPAAERKADVLSYIKQFHNEHRRRPFAAEPWDAQLNTGDSGQMFAQYRASAEARRAVFTGGDLNAAAEDAKKGVAGAFSNDAYPRLGYSEVRLKQGERDKALENLELTMKAGHAPWHVYRSYADMQLAAGNSAKAMQTVEDADRQFGQPLGIAPYAIKVYRTANNSEKVDYYMERCRNGGSRAHIKVCETAAGLESDSGSGQSGGSAAGVRGFFGNIISGGGNR